MLVIASGDLDSFQKTVSENQYAAAAWIVYNPRGAAHEAELRSSLESISALPFEIVSGQPWRGIGPFLEDSKATAKQWSQTLIWICQGEKLSLFSEGASQELGLADDEDAAFVLVQNSGYAIAELRLFSLSNAYTITGEAKPSTTSSRIRYASTDLSIYRSRIKLERENKISATMLDTQIERFPQHRIELSLSASLLNLSLGDFEAAEQNLKNTDSEAQHAAQSLRWSHAYLKGVVALAQENSTLATQFFSDAIDIDSDRLEPFARLISILLDAGENDSAADLADVAKNLAAPDRPHYIESNLYLKDFLALQLKAFTLAEQMQRAGETYTALNHIFTKNASMRAAISGYEAARDEQIKAGTQPNHSPTDNTEQAQFSGKTKSKPVKLTIGMATHDDFDGVYFMLMSLKLFHGDCWDELELLVVDNNPDSAHGEEVKKLCLSLGVRYLAAGEYTGTTVRERIFLEARGEFVMCIDCHVFLHQDVVRRVLNYIQLNPDSKDIWHGPMVTESGDSASTHMDEVWQTCFYGVFNSDARGKDENGPAFEIPMQGLAMFVCKRSEWAGFNRKFRGFGGEEGYIHYKFALNGGITLCLPFMRWTHRFPRPNRPSYPNRWEDRVRNYLIGWNELGRDTSSIYEHYIQQLGHEMVAKVQSHFIAEQDSPFWNFDSVYQLLNDDTENAQLEKSFAFWGLSHSAQVMKHQTDQEQLTALIARIADLAERQRLPNIIVIRGVLPSHASARVALVDILSRLVIDSPKSLHFKVPKSDSELLFIPANQYRLLASLKLRVEVRQSESDSLKRVSDLLAMPA